MTTRTILFMMLLSSLGQAQVLYHNGKIFTGNRSQPWVDYFIVHNGTIMAAGTGHPAPDSIPNRVNLHGQWVIPGIVDSHIHFIDGGLTLLQVNFGTTLNAQEMKQELERTIDQLLDGVYVGRNLAPAVLKNISHPVSLLDHYFPLTPAVIFLKGGHAAIANTRALTYFGFHREKTRTEIGRDTSGKLTGYLFEAAAMEANQAIGQRCSQETIERAILAVQDKAIRFGITLVGDNTFNPYHYKIYQGMQKRGTLKIRIRARSYGRIPETSMLMQGLGRKHLGFIGGGVDPEFVRYHASKHFVDHSLSVSPDTQNQEPGGQPFLEVEQIKNLFLLHPKEVFAFHVQGRRGLKNILTAIEQTGTTRRHILDHTGYTSDSLLHAIAGQNLAVTMIASQLFDAPAISAYYTLRDKTFRSYDLLNYRHNYRITGAALSSDYPYGMDTTFKSFPEIDGLNPLANLAAQHLGQYPDGTQIPGMKDKTLSLEEALVAYTHRGAFVLGEEDRFGMIQPGYRADFAILDSTLFTKDNHKLYTSRVLQTYIAGECIYRLPSAPMKDHLLHTRVKPSDYALSPIIGYDPALGMILGGAYFRFPLKVPGQYFDAQLQVISQGKVNLQSTYTAYGIRRNINVTLNGSYTTFFQYYFGEGNQTVSDQYAVLYASALKVKPELQWLLMNHHQLNFFGDVRSRKETGATDPQGTDLNRRLFPDGTGAALGLSFQKDTRDNAFSAHVGTFRQISLQYIPASWNTAKAGDVVQVAGEIRHFTYLRLQRTQVVLATRLAAGWSFGTPDYLYRYTLGGSFALRGYYNNRFRGDRYYVGQVELRFPVYKRLSGVAFADGGDIADDGFRKPKWTWGAGIRFALNENIKLRLDYGVAKDQQGVFFTFSEAF
ncbi:MAG: amidohydrolase family protein [Cyclobacteriaceae bacterium]|nr:amidohydrolase family protein [Cyclobacteriaceae bacterium]